MNPEEISCWLDLPPNFCGAQVEDVGHAATQSSSLVQVALPMHADASLQQQRVVPKMAATSLQDDVDALVATKQPKSYDQAVAVLVDLRDLAARGRAGNFGIRIEALREAQARKPSFIGRLTKAGL
jgi:hypothetical protein